MISGALLHTLGINCARVCAFASLSLFKFHFCQLAAAAVCGKEDSQISLSVRAGQKGQIPGCMQTRLLYDRA